MSFAGKYLTQGGQMTAYRWRMFLQVNNWISYWLFLLFLALGSAIFYFSTPSEVMDNGTWYWLARINESFTVLMAPGKGRVYDIHYYYAPANTILTLKMTMQQILVDPYMLVMGERLAESVQRAAMISGGICLVLFTAITWFVTRVGRKESEDEYISGMTLTEKPAEVNRMLRSNNELSDLRVGDLHMVKMAEVLNFLMHGTIGVGKSTLIRWMLDYIRKRGDRAIIYDSGCTFTETHYNPATDFILNAHDERCANWQLWGECVDTVDYDNLAASLIPMEGESDPFWVSSSRTICADLAIRMSADPQRSIEKFLKTLLSLSMKNLREYLANTPSANLVEEKIEKTAISIRSVVTNYAKSLRYLQGLDDGTRPPFTIREWMTKPQHDNSWLFISAQARHRKSVRPLISLWVSLATLMLQSMGENSERRVWFIIDEMPSLQRIPELAETLAEARKFGGCFVLGMQNMAQLVHVYGRELAKSIFDLMNTRMYGRSPSAEMAKVVEEELGNQRKRKIREQNSYGLDQVRDGVSLGKDEVNNPIVDYEQIMRLPNLSFYVRLPGEYPVTRLKLKYRQLNKPNVGLIERNIRDALSPELEKVIQENERAAMSAGLTFPSGEEILEDTPVPQTPEPKPVARSPVSTVPKEDVLVKREEKTAVKMPASEPEMSSESKVIQPHLISQKSKQPSDSNVVQLQRSAEIKPSVEVFTSAPAGSALELLNRRKQQSANPVGADDGDGGESMNLDMKVTMQPDGELQLTTAGIAEDLEDEMHGNVYHQATRSMAREEENILHHRHPEDPGYDDHDFDHYDGEPER